MVLNLKYGSDTRYHSLPIGIPANSSERRRYVSLFLARVVFMHPSFSRPTSLPTQSISKRVIAKTNSSSKIFRGPGRLFRSLWHENFCMLPSDCYFDLLRGPISSSISCRSRCIVYIALSIADSYGITKSVAVFEMESAQFSMYEEIGIPEYLPTSTIPS